MPSRAGGIPGRHALGKGYLCSPWKRGEGRREIYFALPLHLFLQGLNMHQFVSRRQLPSVSDGRGLSAVVASLAD